MHSHYLIIQQLGYSDIQRLRHSETLRLINSMPMADRMFAIVLDNYLSRGTFTCGTP